MKDVAEYNERRMEGSTLLPSHIRFTLIVAAKTIPDPPGQL